MSDILMTERTGAIVVLTLNRPSARNALSMGLINALHTAIADASARHDVHVVVLRANGPAFCAGHDLKEMTAARVQDDGGAGIFRDTMLTCAALMQAIIRCPKPVIAEVQGAATAAGCQLVATCDLAVASDAAAFATPGVDIGLFCSTPMVALSRNVPRKAALEMLLTGEMIGAEKAREIGLVNRVVSATELSSTTMGLATRIAAKSPKTLTIGKEAFYRQVDMPLSEAYAYTAEVMVANMLGRDAKEGIGAFLEKRKPQWSPL